MEEVDTNNNEKETTPGKEETIPSEEEIITREKEAHEVAMNDKEMLYSTRIDLMEDTEDAHKGTLKQTVKYVNKEKFADHKTDFEDLVKLSFDEESKDNFDNKIESLSNNLGLDKTVVAGIIDAQKSNLEELTYQQTKKEKSKTESKLKKIGKALGKIAIYGGVGIGLSLVTGGLGAGIFMGVARVAETFLKGKKDRKAREDAIAESKKMFLGEIDTDEETEPSEEIEQENNDLIEKFYDDIFIKLSIAKQNQIDKKGKEHSEIGEGISILEEAYDPKNPESKEELKALYAQRRELHKSQIKKYLEEQGIAEEELNKRVELSAQLVELEDNQKIMELDFAKRKVGAVGKIFAKIDSVLSSPLLLGGSQRGGDQTKEKLITASVFAIAGSLARSCPIVRNVLMAYAGMKLGSAAANLFVSKENKDLLKQISAESINLESSSDDISKAKAQLLDSKFKETDPVEHAKLQEKIFAIDRARMVKALGSPALEGEEGGEENEGYIGETNRRLEETIKKKRAAKGVHKGMKIFLGIAGGAAGWFIGEYMNEQSKNKAEQEQRKEALEKKQEEIEKDVEQVQEAEAKRLEAIALAERQAKEDLEAHQKELARLEELNKEIIVEKGDTSWGLAEDQLEKRVEGWEELPQHQKDYMIDYYKDKMVADPEAVGIDGGNASSLKIGDSLGLKNMFSEKNEITEVMNKAGGLSPEAIKNIEANREIIGKVMSNKLENASSTDLIKTMNIMGGTEQSGAGFVQELQNRATEAMGIDAITPEQTQIVLNNPNVFGNIIDQGIGGVENKNLVEAARLFTGTKEVGMDFVKEITEKSPSLGNEITKRVEALNTNIGEIRGAITDFSEGSLHQATDACNNACDELGSLTKLKDASGIWGSMRRLFHNGDISDQIVNQKKEISNKLFGEVESQGYVLNDMAKKHVGMINTLEGLMNREPNSLVENSSISSFIEGKQKLINGILERAKGLMPKSNINAD